MSILRRASRVLRRAALPLLMLPLFAAAQDSWPSRPITFIVPYAAGSNPDVFTRLVANEVGKRLNATVVVDNVNGAGGVLGTDRVARARPDGYTFLLGVESTILLAQLVKPATVKYDGLKDLTPVALMGTQPLVLVAKPELRQTTMAELIGYARSHPGELNYGTSGVGTSLHLAGELLGIEGKVELTHVPYSVSTQIMTDVAANQLQLAMVPVGSAMPFINAGKVRPLGVTSAQRTPNLPNVPAMGETPGLKGMNMMVWHGLFAPAGLDKAIASRMHAEIAAALSVGPVSQRISDMGFQISVLGGDAFAQFLAAEREKFRLLVVQKNIKAE